MLKKLRNLMMATMLFCVLSPVIAQARQPVLKIATFTGSGLTPSEISTLEKLVASYVAEMRIFRVVDDAGRDMALSETELALTGGSTTTGTAPIAADYILTGNIGRVGDIYVFTLETTKVSSGEKLSVSDTASAINDIVTRSRALTRTLFGQRDDATAQPVVPGTGGATTTGPAAPGTAGATTSAAFRPAPKAEDLLGTWKGDKGFETIRILPNATGIAVLSAGGTMKVRVRIVGDTVYVTQDQPNDPILYRSSSITLDVARRISAEARPMRWIFKLSLDGTTLAGTKESIAVTGTGSAVTVDNTYVREAVWTKIAR